MKKWKENLSGLVNLEYIHFVGVPMKESSHGPIIDLKPNTLERLASIAIIKNRIPLRGKETQFLRKSLSLSLEKFANKLGLTSGSVFHWEKNKNERLTPINEAAVRSLVAEELGIEIPGKFSLLLGDKVREIKIKAS